jgi:hypothetical protein
MIFVFKLDSVYNMGDKLPLMEIPTDLANSQDMELEDFQWWAYSDEFKKWRDKNPKEWVADSYDTSGYSKVTEYISESLKSQFSGNLASIDYPVISYSDYQKVINEAEGDEEEKEADMSDKEKMTKFLFAYNKLLKEGKIKSPLEIKSLNKDSDLAVFMNIFDGENEVEGTLCAFRFKVISISPERGICIVSIDETFPINHVGKGSSIIGVIKKIADVSLEVGKYVATGLIFIGLTKFFVSRVGYMVRGMRLIRSGGIRKPGTLAKIKNAIRARTAGTANGLKNFFKSYGKTLKSGGAIWNFAKETRTTYKVLRGIEQTVKLGTSAMTDAMYALGTTTKATFSSGSKAIPFVGEIIMAAQGIGALYNWYKGNQAPMYSDLKGTIKVSNEFDPNSIELLRPITVCWSQPAGSSIGGMATNFLFNDETRTTMELIKVYSKDGWSIFLVTQMGSKQLSEEMAKHYLTVFGFDNTKKFESHWYDNDDLVFKAVFLDEPKEYGAIGIFKGYCDWNTLMEAYNNAPDQFVVADGDAPDKYEFYFSDSRGDIINVTGNKVSSEEIKKYTENDIEDVFIGKSVNKRGDSRIEVEKYEKPEGEEGEEENPDETKEENKEERKNESYNYKDLIGSDILDFSSFETLVKINEDEEKKDKENDSEEKNEIVTESSEIAIYIVEDKEYANPELRGKFSTGKFTKFIIPKDYINANQDDPIEVAVNTNEVIADPKAGRYVYKKEEKKEEDKDSEDVATNPSPEQVEDDYYVHSTTDDIETKERRRVTIIKDNPVEDGINLMNEFLTDEQKKDLGIDDWKTIKRIKIVKDRTGDIIKIKLINGDAKFGDRRKVLTSKDGENFDLVKKFINEIRKRVKFDKNDEEVEK